MWNSLKNNQYIKISFKETVKGFEANVVMCLQDTRIFYSRSAEFLIVIFELNPEISPLSLYLISMYFLFTNYLIL